MIEPRTLDGKIVQVDLEHLKVHVDVLPFLEEALRRVPTKNRPFIRVAVDLGRVIGTSQCVETDSSDQIYYASRPGRITQTRFVTTKTAQPCRLVTLIMKKAEMNYRLITAYIGDLAEKEVGDPSIRTENERMACENFWSCHALVPQT